MRTFAIALFGAVASAKIESMMEYNFMMYVSEHSKVYQTVEDFNYRQVLFAEKDAFINSVNEDPTSTYTAGHNQFSDWTKEEFDAILGLKGMQMPDLLEDEVDVDMTGVPASMDWRALGKVTPVKNQGQCGSCWAFSTIEVIESAWMIEGYEEEILSTQELVDCTKQPVTQNNGCSGGWYFWSYDWLKTNWAMREYNYPYTSGTTGRETTCQYDQLWRQHGITKVASYAQVQGTDANLKALARQPVNVAVSAGNSVFQSYKSGIITASSGCPSNVDHAIAAVGYGVENGIQYYIVRNSWDTWWGENGYVRIQTSGGAGVCGINQYVYYPTLGF